MKLEERKKAIYVLLAFFMLLIFNAPILYSVNRPDFLGGIPVLFVYLFCAWLSCILLLLFHSLIRTKRKH
ncbi:hypothetical protein [Rurimicrobium arvi]|uniref:DUF3311 domain-containing protein n=1 Tax=Rurimicrobium arvi TaxID=2049916 RepID=A0ABP8MYL1_9BACT